MVVQVETKVPSPRGAALGAALREMDTLIGSAGTEVGRTNVSFHEAREILRGRGHAFAAQRLLELLRDVTNLQGA